MILINDCIIIVIATFRQALISSCTLHVDYFLLQAVADNKEHGAVILRYHMDPRYYINC